MKNNNFGLKKILDAKSQEFQGQDGFLGKDILVPNANKVNSSRNMMVGSNLDQFVVLADPEFPFIFSNYENQVGQYSSSHKKAGRPFKVIDKIVKFKDEKESPYVLIIRYGDGDKEYDLLFRTRGQKLTENYCYLHKNEKIDSLQEGDRVQKDEVLYKSTSFDDDDNYCIGLNVKSVFLIDNRTLEDAIIISDRAAKRFTSHYMDKVTISLNLNDMPLNYYGDKNNYKFMPDIGEKIKNQILEAHRRIDYNTILFDLDERESHEINPFKDKVHFSKGTVIDVDIYSNTNMETLTKYEYNNQLVKYLENQNRYYNEVIDAIAQYVEGSAKVSTDLSYTYRRYKDLLNPDINIRQDKSEFGHIVMEVTVLRESNISVGSKITGRYGNKGVISKILPLKQMPKNEHGEYVDIIFNKLGVPNRLNPAQLFEVEINFISDNIRRRSKTLKTFKEKKEFLFEYIKDVNKDQYKELVKFYNTLDKFGKKKFLSDMEEKGIYLHQPPFWNNMTLDHLAEIYEKYDWIKPYKCTFDGKPVQNRLVFGDMYLLKLKHEPKGKFSVRSVSYINTKGAPSKSLTYKRHQSLYSQTPVRIGEMETTNLCMTDQPDIVQRYLSGVASDELNRRTVAETLLIKDPLKNHVIDFEDPHRNFNSKILKVYFKAACMEIKRLA